MKKIGLGALVIYLNPVPEILWAEGCKRHEFEQFNEHW
jgi:hypothetical protein